MSRVPAALRGALANLIAGARLASFAPVTRHDFRLDAAQLLLMAIVSALVDVAADFVRKPPEALFDWGALGAEFAALAVLVAAAALLAWLLRDAQLFVALPVVVLASLPVVQMANLLPWALSGETGEIAGVAEAAYWLVLAWFLAVLVRSARVAVQPRSRRFPQLLLASLLLASPLFIPPDVLPENTWWSSPSAGAEPEASNAASEAVLALQRELQDEALERLAEHGGGSEPQLGFIGFAPDGDGASWWQQLERAKRVMDTHWNTSGRSLVYVNAQDRLTEAPMASITFLREALAEFAAVSGSEDVLVLYVSGRSNPDGSLKVSLPPLGLLQLSGPGLAFLLKEAGIRWRVIVVATCDSQPFVDALADAETLIVASGIDAAGRAACDQGKPPTALGDVLFGDVLPGAASLPAALEETRRRLAGRGQALTIVTGESIAAQLARVRGAGGSRAALSRRATG